MTSSPDALPVPPVTPDDLPGAYGAADQASLQGQGQYLMLLRADLVLLSLAAILGVAPSLGLPPKGVGVLTILVLVAGVFATLVIRDRRPEREWYGARAIAESAKSLAWKYMAGAEPFTLELSPRRADEIFTATLGELLQLKKDLSWEPGGLQSAKEQITDAMRGVRSLPLDARRQAYLEHRIGDQRRWYAARARTNRELRAKWFNWLIFVQALAIANSAVSIAWSDVSSAPIGVLASIASAILAWMQVKQFQELSQSYSVAAHELGLISARASHATSNQEFSAFVGDAETAMSREHTLWAARRDVY